MQSIQDQYKAYYVRQRLLTNKQIQERAGEPERPSGAPLHFKRKQRKSERVKAGKRKYQGQRSAKKMNRYEKVRYVEGVTKEVRQSARQMWEEWNHAIAPYHPPTFMPPEAKNDNVKIPDYSLMAAICRWVMEYGDEARPAWEILLNKIPESEFLQKGYGNLKNPNLTWMFTMTAKGRGIDRVLRGDHEIYRNQSRFAPDEGV